MYICFQKNSMQITLFSWKMNHIYPYNILYIIADCIIKQKWKKPTDSLYMEQNTKSIMESTVRLKICLYHTKQES
jgi:hypothetical protein